MKPARPLLVTRQRGVSLVIVMVIMLLSSLLILGGSRVANLNEILAGNDTDAQRAFEAAQMLLKDAELDIQDTASNLRPENLSLSKIDNELLQDLMGAAIAAGSVSCANGVCVNQGERTTGVPDGTPLNPPGFFWNDPALLAAYTSAGRGATYGRWTGATAGAAASANPILTATPARAWYWIELLPYSGQTAEWAQDCAPSTAKYLFRITALALGRSGAPTVVQEIFIPKPEGDGRRCPL